MIYGLFGLALVVIGVFIYSEMRQKPLRSFALKGLSSAMFIAIYLYGVATTTSIQSYPLVVGFFGIGLVFGLIGDLVLALRSMRPQEDNHRIILYGTLSFSIGHVFYYMALLKYGSFEVLAILIALILSNATFLASRVMRLNWGPSKWPSLVYSFFLFLVAAQSLLIVINNGFSSYHTTLLLGSVLFAVSDLVLAQIYFAPKPMTQLIPINLSLYYAAQLLLAFSISLI